jgi:hypothetical protein
MVECPVARARFLGCCAHLSSERPSDAQFHPTGSGDTTLDYIQVFCFFLISFIIAVVWSILDRRRSNYSALYPWLRLAVRFTLAFTMLSYGFAKVFPLQFGGQPSMLKLTESVGELSPMGILWTMMSVSTPYTVFCGLAEVGVACCCYSVAQSL